ncbi:MAG: PEGA domain-containing protein [Sandaracinaceae bacterium]|nr:MAG: PEGA domain-containing protein [Sandaracinaceae bacterium]
MFGGAAGAESTEQPSSVGGYTIVGELATGGMAELFLARRVGPEGFARSVVVKRILPHLAKSDEFVRMFLDEARIAAGIRHPNVVSVEELGRDGDSLFMVMEYLSGESLHALIAELARRNRHLDPALAAHVVAEACAGLHAAHEMTDDSGRPLEVVHRDVSPQNLFITYDGSVKVLDFGIAKAADRLTRTETGYFKGKFAYMAPEQIKEQPVDRRADVFALGVVLFEALTGRRLFRTKNPAATLRAVLESSIVRPSAIRPNIPSALDEACLKALSRPIDQRHATAAELRRDLLRAVPPGDDLPEARLKGLMETLFAARAEEKSEMVRRVRDGEQVERLVTEPSEESDIPSVGSDFAQLADEPVAPSGRRGLRWLVGALLALIFAAGVGATFAVMEPSERAAPRRAPRVPVELAFTTEPAGATLHGPEGLVGVTPTTLRVPKTSASLTFRLELDGYAPWTDEVTPTTNQRMHVLLSPDAPPEPEPEVVQAPPPSTSRPTGRSSARRRGRGESRRQGREGNPFQMWN